MKLNKKGFTLVELLAVIVVLAIIALIGYTTIGGVIDDSRHGANASTALSFEQAVVTKCVTMMTLNGGTTPTAAELNSKMSEVLANFNGDKPSGTPSVSVVDSNCESVTLGTLTVNNDTCTKSGSKWNCSTKK